MNGIAQIFCPRCLAQLDQAVETCPICDRALGTYCKVCEKAPALPIVAIGFSTHGKTHLLAALLLTLDYLTSRLPKTSFRAMGEDTGQRLKDWRATAQRQGILPPTPLPEGAKNDLLLNPLVIHLSGFYEARTLLIYDIAGEAFNTIDGADKHLPVLKIAQTVWIVVSVLDLEESGIKSGQSLGDLFAAYQATMERLNATLEGRNVVLVFTKADKLLGIEAAETLDCQKIEDYLQADPFAPDNKAMPVPSMESYERELEAISEELRQFPQHIEGASNLVNLIEAENKMNLRFCAASALGLDSAASNTRAGSNWKRQRVLDPLIWTLLMENKRVDTQTFHLVLDAGTEAGPAYRSIRGSSLPHHVWQRLVAQREVRTWFLGSSSPAARPRHQPPSSPPTRPRFRLIGPLLESLPPTSRVVVISNGPILDLSDFRTTDWQHRLLLICTSDQEAVVNQWDRTHTTLLRTDDDLEQINSLIQNLQ